MDRIKLHIQDETSPLEAVVLGIGKDIGKPRTIDPMSLKHLKNNSYPELKEMAF